MYHTATFHRFVTSTQGLYTRHNIRQEGIKGNLGTGEKGCGGAYGVRTRDLRLERAVS